jgi:hypothetical protein
MIIVCRIKKKKKVCKNKKVEDYLFRMIIDLDLMRKYVIPIIETSIIAVLNPGIRG